MRGEGVMGRDRGSQRREGEWLSGSGITNNEDKGKE